MLQINFNSSPSSFMEMNAHSAPEKIWWEHITTEILIKNKWFNQKNAEKGGKGSFRLTFIHLMVIIERMCFAFRERLFKSFVMLSAFFVRDVSHFGISVLRNDGWVSDIGFWWHKLNEIDLFEFDWNWFANFLPKSNWKCFALWYKNSSKTRRNRRNWNRYYVAT